MLLFGVVAGVFPPYGFAQSRPPDVAAILANVSRTYKNLNQYTFHATVTEETRTNGAKAVTKAVIVVAVQRPERIRFDVNGSGSTQFTGMYVGDEVAVSDGTDFFLYLPKFNQYTKTPLRLSSSTQSNRQPVSPMGTVPAFIDHVEGVFLDWYQVVGASADHAHFIGDESVSVDGRPVSCHVVEIKYEPPFPKRTIWVDKSRSVVLREVMDSQNPQNLPSLTKTTAFSAAQFGPPIRDDVFVFSAPAGAKLVNAFGQK